MDEDTYCAAVEAVAKNYESRIAALLADFATTAATVNWLTDGLVQDMTADDFEWHVTIKPARLLAEATDNGVDADEGENVDIAIKIEESLSHDGTTAGINFSLDIVLGGILPFNYSPQVWVDVTDADAVEERFKMIEDAWMRDFIALLPDQNEAIDRLRLLVARRRHRYRRLVTPHGMCKDYCVEHERDPEVEPCRIVAPVCSVGGCWEPRVPDTEFCESGPSHRFKR